jgi:hypothetical protein
MNPIAKTATDAKGNRLKVGDAVKMIEIDLTREPQTTRIVKMHRQGFDGTILTCDKCPDLQYPHHFSVQAKWVEKQTL